MAYSERLERVLGEPDGLLVGVSGSQVAIRVARLGEEMSPATANNLKKGLYGRDEEMVRLLARAYGGELLQRHGEEIERVFGEATPQTVEDWLSAVATDRWPMRALPASGRPAATGADEPDLADRVAEKVIERLAVATPADWFWKEIRRLSNVAKEPLSINLQDGSDALSWEDARALIAEYERLIAEGRL